MTVHTQRRIVRIQVPQIRVARAGQMKDTARSRWSNILRGQIRGRHDHANATSSVSHHHQGRSWRIRVPPTHGLDGSVAAIVKVGTGFRKSRNKETLVAGIQAWKVVRPLFHGWKRCVPCSAVSVPLKHRVLGLDLQSVDVTLHFLKGVQRLIGSFQTSEKGGGEPRDIIGGHTVGCEERIEKDSSLSGLSVPKRTQRRITGTC
jgi:hypothetical protein